MRGLKRQQVAALTNLVGCFFYCSVLLLFFSPSALNDLAGASAGPLARKTYSHSHIMIIIIIIIKTWILFAMSAYSFDESKFTSARKKKRKESENNKPNSKIYSA